MYICVSGAVETQADICIALSLVAYGQRDAAAAHSLLVKWYAVVSLAGRLMLSCIVATIASFFGHYFLLFGSLSSKFLTVALPLCSLELKPTHVRCLFALVTLGLVQNNPVLAASALQEVSRLDSSTRLVPKNAADYALLKSCLQITAVCLLDTLATEGKDHA